MTCCRSRRRSSTRCTVSSTLAPPGWNRKPLNSTRLIPLASRKSCTAGLRCCRNSCGSSGLSTTPKPSCLMSQPVMCSVSRAARTRPCPRYGPRALGVAQHDARGAIAEQRCRHEHGHARIVDTKAETAKIDGEKQNVSSGHRLRIAGGACKSGNATAAAEPEDWQPLDRRAGRSSRFISLASRLGIATPVMVLTTMAPISLSSMPAARIAPTATTCSRSSAWCRNTSVRSSQPRSRSYQSDGSHVYRVSIAVLRTGPHSRQRSGKSRLARRAASAWPSLLQGTAVAMPAISTSKATLRQREVRIARAVLSISRSREAGLFRKCQFGPSSIMGTSGCAAPRTSILRVDRVKIAAIGDLPSGFARLFASG